MRNTMYKALLICLAISALNPAQSALAQNQQTLVHSEAGRHVATAFLLELANPLRALATYRVGVVYADVGVGLLISPKGSPPVVEYIEGAGQDNMFLRRQLVNEAIEQVRNPPTSEFRFHVVRKILTTDNCPDLGDTLAAFYAALDSALYGTHRSCETSRLASRNYLGRRRLSHTDRA